MKGTEQFKEIIKNYLDNRAKEDELFRAKYETTERTIDDVVTYILNEVKQSGCCGFSDMEVFSMAVHAIDELTLEIGKPVNCGEPSYRPDRGGKGGAKGTRPQTLPRGGAAQVASAPLQAKDKQAARDETTPTLTF